MMENKPDFEDKHKKERAFIRLEETMKCSYKYDFLGQEKENEGTILDLSGGGIKMIAPEYFKKGVIVNLYIDFPFGKLVIKSEVVGIRQDWYLTDLRHVSYWTVNLKFTELPIEQRRQIIHYVYKCFAERHKAQQKSAESEKNKPGKS